MSAAPSRAALTALYEHHGAHLTNCVNDPDREDHKGALDQSIDYDRRPLDRVLRQCAKGDLAGIFPASVGNGCVVFDVDHGGQEAVDELVRVLGQPLVVVPSGTPGRFHVWYLCDDAREIGNGDWSLDGAAPKNGELRSTGNLVLWHPEKVSGALANGAKPGDAIPARLNPAQVERVLVATPRPRKGNGAAPMNGRAIVTDYDRARAYREQEWVGGGRNVLLNALVFACGLANDEALAKEITEWVIANGHQPERAARATFKSGWTKGQEARASKPVEVSAAYTPKGLVAALNIVGIGGARLNERAQKIELLSDGSWHALDDYFMQDLRCIRIPARCLVKKGDQTQRLVYSRERLVSFLQALVHTRRVDPFLTWVEQLPPWDNKPRIDGLLSRLFGAADDDLSRWASRYIGLGALQRSYQPGSKLDETPVLIGDQDVGKSAFTKAWFDAEHIHWHGEGADLAAKGKEQAEALDGRVIVELSELDGVKKADITKLKAFLTRTDDGSFRRAYAMFTQPNPRRCIFIGTANPSELGVLPNDSSGNRRLIPIELNHGCHVEAVAEAERLQWWGEALARYRAGERANLPRELKLAAAERANEHRADDAMEAELRNQLVDLDCEGGFTLNELHELRFGHGTPAPNRPDQMRYSIALRNLGLKKARVMRDGSRCMMWVGPPPPPVQEPEF